MVLFIVARRTRRTHFSWRRPRGERIKKKQGRRRTSRRCNNNSHKGISQWEFASSRGMLRLHETSLSAAHIGPVLFRLFVVSLVRRASHHGGGSRTRPAPSPYDRPESANPRWRSGFRRLRSCRVPKRRFRDVERGAAAAAGGPRHAAP